MPRIRIGRLGVASQLICALILTLRYQQCHAENNREACNSDSNSYSRFGHGSVVTSSTPTGIPAITKPPANISTSSKPTKTTRGSSATNSASTTTPAIPNFPRLDPNYLHDYIKRIMEQMKEIFKTIWESFPSGSSDGQIGKRRKRALNEPDCSGAECILILDMTAPFGELECPPEAVRFYTNEFTFNATNVANVSFKKENGQDISVDKTSSGSSVFYKLTGELDAKQINIKFTVLDPENVAVSYQNSFCIHEQC